jgi:hypothetical protein
VISAAINSLLTGCLLAGGDDCSCPKTPERPERQAPLLIDEVAAWNASGNDDTLPADPRGGTAEVTGDQLVIRYERDGMSREVVYAVESVR